MAEPALAPNNLRSLCEVLAATDDGLTNAEIDRLLVQCKIPDPTPRGKPGLTYVAVNKRNRLEAALSAQQQRDSNGTRVLRFVKAALDPAFHIKDEDRLTALRDETNVALKLIALRVEESGQLVRVKPAATLSEARQRAHDFKLQIVSRSTHPRLIAACVDEIDDDNYFHAVLEAAKSLASFVRERTGLTSDGVALVDQAFEKGKRAAPLLVLNDLKTDTGRARQRGLADGLRSIFSSMRNPVAHEPKRLSQMTQQDALDAFAWMSFLHRQLDDCHVTTTV